MQNVDRRVVALLEELLVEVRLDRRELEPRAEIGLWRQLQLVENHVLLRAPHELLTQTTTM